MPNPMPSCLFCKIARGEIPSAKVYEDADTLAFLDINPLTQGHTLVIPKQHAVRVEELGAMAIGRLFERAARILPALSKATGRGDTLIALHNGPEAGQEVPHVHVHLVPRSRSDGAGPVHALFTHRAKMDAPGLAELAEKVRSGVPA